MVKHLLSKIIGIFLLLAFILNTVSCNTSPDDGNYTRINGKTLYFVTDKQKQSWKKTLTELMEKAFIAAEEWENSPDYDLLPKQDETAIAMSYACGLLDITMDGVPELLVYPNGYSGSSGTTTYFAYDINSGEYLGDLDGGGGESICFYYDTESNRPVLGVQYWIRCGWDYRRYAFELCEYDPPSKDFHLSLYLNAAHQTYFSDKILPDGSRDTYDCVHYSSNGISISHDTYHEERQAFEKRYVRIIETEFEVIRWDQVANYEDDNGVRIERMVEALLNSNQKFLKP